MDVEPEEEIGTRLREIGISAADVRWVVLTHLHTDHAAGLTLECRESSGRTYSGLMNT